MGGSRRLKPARDDGPACEGDPGESWETTEREDEDMAFRYGSWNLLDHFFLSPRPMFSLSARIWNPPVDVSETSDHISIRMEIAGVRPSDLSVTMEHGILIIRGQRCIVRGRRCDRPSAQREEFHLMEIRHGHFERAFRLSGAVVESGIKASYRDGFLDIEVPKGAGKGKSVTIKVRED